MAGTDCTWNSIFLNLIRGLRELAEYYGAGLVGGHGGSHAPAHAYHDYFAYHPAPGATHIYLSATTA